VRLKVKAAQLGSSQYGSWREWRRDITLRHHAVPPHGHADCKPWSEFPGRFTATNKNTRYVSVGCTWRHVGCSQGQTPRPLVTFLFCSYINDLLLVLSKLKIEEKDSVVNICTFYWSFADTTNNSGHVVVQLVEALPYEPVGRGFDSRCHWNNPSGRTMALGVVLASNRNQYQEYFLEGKGGRCWPYHLHVPIVVKSGRLNLLDPPGPVQVCTGISVPFTKSSDYGYSTGGQIDVLYQPHLEGQLSKSHALMKWNEMK